MPTYLNILAGDIEFTHAGGVDLALGLATCSQTKTPDLLYCRRRHQTLGYVSPEQFEAQNLAPLRGCPWNRGSLRSRVSGDFGTEDCLVGHLRDVDHSWQIFQIRVACDDLSLLIFGGCIHDASAIANPCCTLTSAASNAMDSVR